MVKRKEFQNALRARTPNARKRITTPGPEMKNVTLETKRISGQNGPDTWPMVKLMEASTNIGCYAQNLLYQN